MRGFPGATSERNPALLFRYDQGRFRAWYRQLKLWYTVFAVVSICLYWRFW